MAPPRRSGPRPVRALALLAVVILVMLISITGKETFHPAKWQQQFKVGLGLDLAGGTEVVLQAHTSKGVPTQGAMNQAISVLLSRVNGTGNSGAQVQQQGADLINVTIPGQPPENVLKLVSTTAKMAFRPVYLVQPYTGAATPNPVARPSSTATPSTSASAEGVYQRAVGAARQPDRYLDGEGQHIRDAVGERQRVAELDGHDADHVR